MRAGPATQVTPAARAVRLPTAVARVLAAVILGLLLLTFLADRATPWLPRVLVVAMIAVASRLPIAVLPVLAALVPFGDLLAPVPFRASEALAMGWLFGVLLPIRRAERAGDPPVDTRVLLAAWSFVAIVLASLAVRLSLRDIGLAPWPLAVSVIQSLGTRYLVSAGADQTVAAAVLPIEGVLLFAAMVIVGQRDRRLPARLVAALAGAGAVAAVLSLGHTAYVFVRHVDPRLVLRFLAGERFSVIGPDVNAAGSLLALSGMLLTSFAGWSDRRGRAATIALILTLPAVWLTGSRAAMVALALAAGAMVWWRRSTRAASAPRTPRAVVLGAWLLLLATVAYLAWTVLQVTPGSAGRALALRTQFTRTSARMFLTAPWFGVGIGQYYGLSGLFMPEALREVYGFENAHNYFLQVAAELGAVGAAAFAWLLAWPLRDAWRGVREHPGDRVQVASIAGVIAYLLTCTTGHPLLVPQAALPLWIALAAVALAARRPVRAPADVGRGRRALRWLPVVVTSLVVCAMLVSFPFRAAAVMNTVTTAPADDGFREPGTAPDGRPFRWMAPVVTFHVPSGAGLLQIPLRAPYIWTDAPFAVDVFVSGWLAQRVTLPPNQWQTVAVPFREAAPFHFRKITLRANQAWLPGRAYALHDGRPMGVWAGDYEFIPRSK